MVSALDRKLLRDLWRLRGQVLAIGLVIASGVGLLVMSLTSLEALRDTSAAYYERYRFADALVRLGGKRSAGNLAMLSQTFARYATVQNDADNAHDADNARRGPVDGAVLRSLR